MQLKTEFKDAVSSLIFSKGQPSGTASYSKHTHLKSSIDSTVDAKLQGQESDSGKHVPFLALSQNHPRTGSNQLEGAETPGVTERTSFYEILQSNDGFLSLQEYFLRNLNGAKGDDETRLKGRQAVLEADEFAFGRVIMRILGNIDEIYILDTFDTIDSRCTGTIGFKEFYICVLMWAAKEEGETTHALYLHGQKFFELVSAGQEVISAERLLKFGRIIGFKEEVLLDSLAQILGKSCTMANSEDFITYYYYLFSQYDQAFKNFNLKPVAVPAKATPSSIYAAPMVRGGCCTAKICQII